LAINQAEVLESPGMEIEDDELSRQLEPGQIIENPELLPPSPELEVIAFVDPNTKSLRRGYTPASLQKVDECKRE
jgi:hypothetical protein